MALRTYTCTCVGAQRRCTCRYRLYPTMAQERLFARTLEACRWVYNKTLEVRKAAWEGRQESLNLYATNQDADHPAYCDR